jgi:hypothetical protein
LDSFLIGLGLTAVTILSISGTFAAQIAIARRRSAILWFIYGVALGPLGPVLVWLSPPAICPVCGTRTRGWLRRCDNCGVDTTQPARGPLIGVVAGRAATRAVAHPALLPVRGDRAGTRRSARPEPVPSAVPDSPPPTWTEPAASTAPSMPWTSGGPAQQVPVARETTRELPPPPARQAPVEPAPSARPTPVPEVRVPAPAPTAPAAPAATAATAFSGITGGSFVMPAAAAPGSGAERNGTPAARPLEAAVAGPAADPGDGASSPTSLLATGVFTGGTAGLVVGARYAIVRAGVEFQVLGPLDSSPDSVVLRRPLDELDPLCVNDRCIISHRSQPTRALIAMRGIAGLTGEHLEAGLRPTPRVGVAVS